MDKIYLQYLQKWLQQTCRANKPKLNISFLCQTFFISINRDGTFFPPVVVGKRCPRYNQTYLSVCVYDSFQATQHISLSVCVSVSF